MYKKSCLLFVLFFSICLLCSCNNLTSKSYLRIHIRANSNLEIDQKIKYVVKDKLTDYITPLIYDLKSKDGVIDILNKNISNMENVCNEILFENGFNYESNIQIKNELFPTRYYGDLVLVSDYYDALIVNLGSGEGDNWWCVVYPPLCFVESCENVVYKSKIMEIINKFLGR